MVSSKEYNKLKEPYVIVKFGSLTLKNQMIIKWGPSNFIAGV